MVFMWHEVFKEGRENVEDDLVLEEQSRQQMIKCGSGASCDGERSPIECQDDCRKNGLG